MGLKISSGATWCRALLSEIGRPWLPHLARFLGDLEHAQCSIPQQIVFHMIIYEAQLRVLAGDKRMGEMIRGEQSLNGANKNLKNLHLKGGGQIYRQLDASNSTSRSICHMSCAQSMVNQFCNRGNCSFNSCFSKWKFYLVSYVDLLFHNTLYKWCFWLI
jgi:hypothetical protein